MKLKITLILILLAAAGSLQVQTAENYEKVDTVVSINFFGKERYNFV